MLTHPIGDDYICSPSDLTYVFDALAEAGASTRQFGKRSHDGKTESGSHVIFSHLIDLTQGGNDMVDGRFPPMLGKSCLRAALQRKVKMLKKTANQTTSSPQLQTLSSSSPVAGADSGGAAGSGGGANERVAI